MSAGRLARLVARFVGVGALLLSARAPAAEPFQFQITSAPGGSVDGGPPGGDALTDAEIDFALLGNLEDTDPDAVVGTTVNRTVGQGAGRGPEVTPHPRAKSNPEVVFTLAGLNHHDQRAANGGNQFFVEPPDQALCAGNGFVLESVNEVLRIYDAGGTPLTSPVDLNTFYGYPAAVDRAASPVTFGPVTTDPSCYYDADTQRWFHVILTLERAFPTTQALSGVNHLDIAVSTTPDPRGSWVVYRIPAQNDGTEGTPNHHCIRSGTTHPPGPCMGDYPHIGADAYGFYVSTNEFNLFASGFHGAQIYALSKRQLAANAATVNVVLFDTTDPVLRLDGAPGFTVWPAHAPAAGYDMSDGGTEFLLSSLAVFSPTRVDDRLRVWSITNTSSLDSATPAPVLGSRTARVLPYAVPGSVAQKPGNVPLLECLADPACSTPPFRNSIQRVPSGDSGMHQVVYANGKLWGALDTGLVQPDGTRVSGIAYFILNPHSAGVFQQGYVALENNHLTYPAVAATPSGRGAIAFTVLGPDHFPSAGYVSLDAVAGAGPVHVVSEGLGPQDGFLGYFPITNPIRPRWGDYGAAVADGNVIWIASETIEQTCTYAEFLVNVPGSRFGTCNETRNSLANWGTRITKLSVGP